MLDVILVSFGTRLHLIISSSSRRRSDCLHPCNWAESISYLFGSFSILRFDICVFGHLPLYLTRIHDILYSNQIDQSMWSIACFAVNFGWLLRYITLYDLETNWRDFLDFKLILRFQNQLTVVSSLIFAVCWWSSSNYRNDCRSSNRRNGECTRNNAKISFDSTEERTKWILYLQSAFYRDRMDETIVGESNSRTWQIQGQNLSSPGVM